MISEIRKLIDCEVILRLQPLLKAFSRNKIFPFGVEVLSTSTICYLEILSMQGGCVGGLQVKTLLKSKRILDIL